MLRIETNKGRWQSWWLGYSIPPAAKERVVVVFQADGDELNLFLAAMQASAEGIKLASGNILVYDKIGGFREITKP